MKKAVKKAEAKAEKPEKVCASRNPVPCPARLLPPSIPSPPPTEDGEGAVSSVFLLARFGPPCLGFSPRAVSFPGGQAQDHQEEGTRGQVMDALGPPVPELLKNDPLSWLRLSCCLLVCLMVCLFSLVGYRICDRELVLYVIRRMGSGHGGCVYRVVGI